MFYSNALGISSSGDAVVGLTKGANGTEAFLWTKAGGMVGLGDLTGGAYYSTARNISGDGNIVVGGSNSTNGGEAFRWTQAGGMVGLGDLAGGTFGSQAYGVSADGNVVVGYGVSTNGPEAFRWTQAGGMVGLGDLTGGYFSSYATSVSADGNVVVGTSNSTSGSEAFRWTQAGGMVGLGDLAGGNFLSQANSVSADGNVVVGWSEITNGNEAFRWTQAGGMVGLGDIAGGSFNSEANSVSADGNVVVGEGMDANGNVAFRWTQATGMQRIDDILTASGVDLAGWSALATASAVNSDGSVITGYGLSTNGLEAYIVKFGDNSGIVGLTDLSNSLDLQVAPHTQLESLTSLTLNGAHHRSLMDMAMSDGEQCGWVSADLGRVHTNGNGWTSLAEVGACHDFANNALRAGIGIGQSQAHIDQAWQGRSQLNGQYVLAELDWNVPNTKLTASALAMVGRWDVKVRRGYSAGTVTSDGETDMNAASFRTRLDWHDAFALGAIRFSPSVQYTVTRTRADAYQETGGTAAATFDSQRHQAQESRLGLTGAYMLSQATTVYGRTEWAHRFDNQAASISGSANILGVTSMPFSIQGNDIRQNWLRIGADVVHQFNKMNRLSLSANIASAGQDPDLSVGITWNTVF